MNLKLAISCLLLASLIPQSTSVDMTFDDNLDHKFVSTKIRDYYTAGYYPDIMEL